MSMNITCDLLNKLMGLEGEQPDDHTEKWKRMRSTGIDWPGLNDCSFYEHIMKAMRALADSGDYGFECVPMYSSGRAHVYMFRAI